MAIDIIKEVPLKLPRSRAAKKGQEDDGDGQADLRQEARLTTGALFTRFRDNFECCKVNIAHLNDDLPEGHRKVTVCDQKIQEVQQPLLVYSDQHPVMTSPKSPS